MEIFPAILALCEGNPSVTGGFPSQSPATRSFDFFFDLRLNKRLSKQSRRRWLETQSRSLWLIVMPRSEFFGSIGLLADINRVGVTVATCGGRLLVGIYFMHDCHYMYRRCISYLPRSVGKDIMMMSSNWDIFRVTGHLCGEFTGPRTKASDAEHWCFVWSTSE